jgi:predicted AAA+ superfamily ATPase
MKLRMETIEISTSALREFERTYKISPEYIEV